MKTQRLFFRATPEDLDVLNSVSETLGLDASSTIWSVLRKEQRELAVQAALAAPSATKSKKRRSRAA